MDKNLILNILNDWNFWNKSPEVGFLRKDYLKKIENFVKTNQVSVITGARRSGKSFLMRQFAYQLISNGLNPRQILLINFEDQRFNHLDVALLDQIYQTYLEFLKPEERPYIFLDEIQEVKSWEKWVRTMHELNKAHIIVSGSNAKLLSSELATLLTGRHLSLEVWPLSFKEILGFHKLKLNNPLDYVNQEIKIRQILNGVKEFGSFPAVAANENEEIKKRLLAAYFDDILYKDLIRRFKIRKTEKIKSLLKFYLSNTSSLTTFNSSAKSLDIAADTVEKFTGYLEAIYLIFSVKRFSYKVREQEKSPRKIYAIDPGLINTVGFKFSHNEGKIIENIVFLELLRKRKDLFSEIYYWKDEQHREVDFVIKEGDKIKSLIQVCARLDDIKTQEREVKSLILAMNNLDIQEGIIITSEGEEKEEIIKNKKIFYKPLLKWLLE
jgi:hypothetical protein